MQITIAPRIFSSVFKVGSQELQVNLRPSLLGNYTTKLAPLGVERLTPPREADEVPSGKPIPRMHLESLPDGRTQPADKSG